MSEDILEKLMAVFEYERDDWPESSYALGYNKGLERAIQLTHDVLDNYRKAGGEKNGTDVESKEHGRHSSKDNVVLA